MKEPYRANVNDFENDNDEIDEIEDEYKEEETELKTFHRKRKKVTDNLTDNVPKKRKKLHKDLYKPPTVDELHQLRETETLFHSNLFRLQIEEMLNEVKVKDKYKRLFDVWFENFKSSIKSIKETESYQLSDKTFLEQLNVHVPMPHVPEDTKGTFKFLKPSDIAIIGSYMFDATIGTTINVDVMIEMPAKMFQKQDYRNYIYMKKKAMYLGYIASNITNDIAQSKKFVGDNLRPILKIVPNGKLGTKMNILVHISAQEESFKTCKFLPDKNNVKSGWFFNDSKNEDLLPTPHYNSIILRDLTLKKHSEVMKQIKELPNLKDGIILLKIWLTQRELIKGYAGFSGYIVTMLVMHLLSIKKLNTFMSSYQILRIVWNYLVHLDRNESGIVINHYDTNKDKVLNFCKYYDCVFLDDSCDYNIAACISKETFCWVQKEAELCLNHLDSPHANSFQSLFMRKVPFHMAFDHLILLKDAQVLRNIVETYSDSKEKLNYGPNYQDLAIKVINNTLKKGLTNRVSQICILPNKFAEWECTQNNCNDIQSIIIGLELDPENCFNIVDKGPEANLPEAIEFRNYWGKKSELRRFKDGTIREAVVWSKGKMISGKRIICKKIVTFLFTQKLGLHKTNFVYIANEVEELLKLQKIKITHFAYGTGEEAALKAINAFNNFEKDLMSLTDIPLSIHGVQGSSAVFRYADVFPPLATVHRPNPKLKIKPAKNNLILSDTITVAPKYVQPLEISLQLSTSGKWPDELEAFRKTKASFHIQIAECLRKQYALVTNANFSHVDVYKDGFVFRLRVALAKEISCLKEQITEDGVTQYRDNDESIELEIKLFELPKLTGALHGLHVQQPSFGATCCLTKRWLSAQLLDDFHIPAVVVELLVASIYLIPAPYRSAQMPQVAFLRILEFFAGGHWNTDPIIVNFNNEMSKDEIIALETLFGSSRSSLPPLFIATPYDQRRSIWTKKAPTTLILNRIMLLARQSLKMFEDQLFTKTLLDLKPLFRPPLTEYDCLIHLKPDMVPRRLQAVDVEECPILEWHPYKKHSAQKIPVVDFDPVQCYLKDLRDGYSEFALFFHDTYGGTLIGVLIKPCALETKDFKVQNINGRKLNNDGRLILNISTIVEDFFILGKGLVESINIQSQRFTIT